VYVSFMELQKFNKFIFLININIEKDYG
jgi:hypothetical protein